MSRGGVSRGGGDRGRRQREETGCGGGGGVSGEDERNGERKIIEKVKERVRDREGQDVEGGEKWEARRG